MPIYEGARRRRPDGVVYRWAWARSSAMIHLMAIVDVLTRAAISGRVGPVIVGADWGDVTAALGEAVDLGPFSRSRHWPRLFAYGDLEISVCRCRRVNLICVQTWRDAVELPTLITEGPAVSPAAISYDTVVTALDDAGCPWEPDPRGTFGDQRTIAATATKASFTFETLDDGGMWLNVMGLPGDGHTCPARRRETGERPAEGASPPGDTNAVR